MRPMPMTSYLTTIGIGSVLPVKEHRIKLRCIIRPTAHFNIRFGWLDLALECRDQKATVNQTKAILTAYIQSFLSWINPNQPFLVDLPAGENSR